MYQREQKHRDNCAKMRDLLLQVIKDENFNFGSVINVDDRLYDLYRKAPLETKTDYYHLYSLSVENSLIGLVEQKPMLHNCGTTACVFGYSPGALPELIWSGQHVVRRDGGDIDTTMDYFAKELLGLHWYYFEGSGWDMSREVTREDCIAMLHYFTQPRTYINPMEDRNSIPLTERQVNVFHKYAKETLYANQEAKDHS